MSPKDKKRPDKEAPRRPTAAWPWPDFPSQLISLIGEKPGLMRDVCFGGVTKSWRAASKQCNPVGGVRSSPWLELGNAHSHNLSHSSRSIFSVPFRQGFYRTYWWHEPRPAPSTVLAGFSSNCLIHFDSSDPGVPWHQPTTAHLDFLEFQHDRYHKLSLHTGIGFIPTWNSTVPFTCATVSSSSVVVFTGLSYPAFLHYPMSNNNDETKAWETPKHCAVSDPSAPEQSKDPHAYLQITNAISLGTKIYALSLQGTIVVVEIHKSQPVITSMGKSRAIPTVHNKHFKEHLIQFDGKVFVVFLISKKSVNLVDTVEVFRLEAEKLAWTKLGSLADKALFVGRNCGMMVLAGKVGCRPNSVYFSRQNGSGWSVFDARSGSISAGTESSKDRFQDWDDPPADNEDLTLKIKH